MGCHWCDVKESWDVNAHPKLFIKDILKEIPADLKPIVVITGGEPLQHNLEELTRQIKNLGLRTHIETSGAFEPSGTWDWFCLSPKKFKKATDVSLKLADELKIIVYNKSDFAFAEEYAKLVKPDCKLYLQPEWDKRDQIYPELVTYIKKHPQWKLSLQTHKYLNIP